MIQWHRQTIRDEYGVPILVYCTEEEDWRAYSIDRIPCSNGSRTSWYEYRVIYKGEAMYPMHYRLRDAKEYVERAGRKLDDSKNS